MKVAAFLLALILVMGSSCAKVDSALESDRVACEKGFILNECMSQLLNTAYEYMKTNYPSWPEVKEGFVLAPRLTDKGKVWELTFNLDENMQGGVPVFEFDKVTGKIVKAYHTQ